MNEYLITWLVMGQCIFYTMCVTY